MQGLTSGSHFILAPFCHPTFSSLEMLPQDTARTHRLRGVVLLEGENLWGFWCWQGKGLCQNICDMVAAAGWCPNRIFLGAHLFSPATGRDNSHPDSNSCCSRNSAALSWGDANSQGSTQSTPRACTHFNTGPNSGL